MVFNFCYKWFFLIIKFFVSLCFCKWEFLNGFYFVLKCVFFVMWFEFGLWLGEIVSINCF